VHLHLYGARENSERRNDLVCASSVVWCEQRMQQQKTLSLWGVECDVGCLEVQQQQRLHNRKFTRHHFGSLLAVR
jgi:hypothetical protein